MDSGKIHYRQKIIILKLLMFLIRGFIMYLKKFKLIYFRKFAENENEIEFTNSQGIKKPMMVQLILLQLQP